MCTPETEVAIASLLPYETAAVFDRVQRILGAIDRGEDRTMKPISIFTFDGSLNDGQRWGKPCGCLPIAQPNTHPGTLC